MRILHLCGVPLAFPVTVLIAVSVATLVMLGRYR